MFLHGFLPRVRTLLGDVGMVRTVNVDFDDDEFEELSKMKRGRSWHDYILEVARKEAEVK